MRTLGTIDASATSLLQFDLGSPDDVGGGVEEDARTLLAILKEDGQPVTRSVAEEATGWTAERFRQAIRTANHLLTGTGSRLLVDSNDHLVTRSDAPDIDTDAVARFQKLRVKPEAKPKPMDSFEVAKALWPLVHGNAETFRKGDADPQVLRQLADEGVLERFEDGFWFTPKIIKLLNLDLVSTSQMRRRRMT